MKLQGKKILILIATGFEDLEFYVPYMRLIEEGASVTVAGVKEQETYMGKIGLYAHSDAAIDDLEANDFDAVFIPGGWAPDRLRRIEKVKSLVRDFYQTNKIVALICHAGLVGISAGIVHGHQATGSEGIKDDLINAGAVWVDQPAFRSGNIVWGRVVQDIPVFCRELIQVLSEENS